MSQLVLETTSADVLALFNGSPAAVQAFRRWSQDEHRAGVHEVVLDHVVRHAYTVLPEAVSGLNQRIRSDSNRRDRKDWPTLSREALHPLGKIASAEVKPTASLAARRIADWSPPLAFNHAFHYLLEQRQGELFTYPEFCEASTRDAMLVSLLTKSAWQLFDALVADGHSPDLLFKAFRWRVGCAYYSFLRELYVLGVLRREKPGLRIHPLADTLFRTDFWSPEESVELLIKNETYKSGLEGRKPPMDDYVDVIFAKRSRIQLDPPRVFGQAYLPSADEIHQHWRDLGEARDGDG